jgi:hypothetical protein
MALILGLRPNDKFYIGDIPVYVSEFNDCTHARVVVHGVAFKIDDKQSVEIYPQVFVSCGKPSEQQKVKHRDMLAAALAEKRQRQEALATGKLTQEEFDNLPQVLFPFDLLPRMIIEAPRSLTILREDLWKKSQHVHQQGTGEAGVSNTA